MIVANNTRAALSSLPIAIRLASQQPLPFATPYAFKLLAQQPSPFHSSAFQGQKPNKRKPGKSRIFLYRRWNLIKPYIHWPSRKSARLPSFFHKPWTRLSASNKRNRPMSNAYGSSSDDVGMKARAAFSSFKNRASNYMNTIATKNANSSYGREISRLISAGSVASTKGPPGTNLIPLENEPSEDEVLMVYPSYSRMTDDGSYEVDVRGWLYLPGQPNRKSKMVLATAKKIAGVKSDTYSRPRGSKTPPQFQSVPRSNSSVDLISLNDDEEQDIKDLKKEYQDAPAPPPPPPRRPSSASILSTQSVTQEEVLQARLAPFLTRAVANRTVKITFSGLTDSQGQEMKVFKAETNSSGRFSIRVQLENKPSIVSVEAHEKLVQFEEVICIEPEGISVISDIDDTIKNTGILGNKRELFRNVFVYDYEKISIEGVQQWYQQLQQMGAKFHYVSNSPWQLYPTIAEYLRSSGLPRGSMHLKEYSGLLTGVFEPASEKKKINLNGIMKDFPRRKFILIGDSGEGDLEAYIDIAKRYPSQILAIYIRDVTLPPGDKTSLLVSGRPITRYPTHATSPTSTDSSRSLLDEAPKPPPPPKSRAGSTPLSSPSPAPSSSSQESQNAPNFAPDGPAARKPPPVPPKPAKLSVKKPEEEAPPPLPPRPSYTPPGSSTSDVTGFAPPPPLPRRHVNESSHSLSRGASPAPSTRSGSNPVIMSSSQDDYEFNDIIDKRVESWKYRITTARTELAEEIYLSTWRVGDDVRSECMEIVSQHKK